MYAIVKINKTFMLSFKFTDKLELRRTRKGKFAETRRQKALEFSFRALGIYNFKSVMTLAVTV